MNSNIDLPNNSSHPLRPPMPLPLPLSFSSLPEDIVLRCLARISRWQYPKLTLVSKSFRSLILSKTLYMVRAELDTKEKYVYLRLYSIIDDSLIWFSLWIKPDHQSLAQCTTQEKSTGNLLVPVSSAYSLLSPKLISLKVGSDFYILSCQKSLSSEVKCRGVIGKWRAAPSMMVARKEPLICVLQGKIYVMGGCGSTYYKYWAEVFDPKTQTWKPLPDPGGMLRHSSYRRLLPMGGNIYLKTNTNNFVYLVKENKWEEYEEPFDLESVCVIENVRYSYDENKCWWYERESKEWRLINGLTGLDAYSKNDTEICNYGGKLVIFWDSPPLSPLDLNKKIWCAVILLDKSHNGEVWGQIEWVDVVCTLRRTQSHARIHSCVVMTY